MISIPFKFETEHGKFEDAIVLTEQERAALSDEQVEAIKQQRLNNWINLIENPPVVEEQPI